MKLTRLPNGFRRPFTAAALLLALTISGCGGGGGGGGAAASSPEPTPPSPSSTGSNVQPLVVDAGPPGLNRRLANILFTSVTVCMPGSTTQCQTIDHVLVDTGSSGLRLLSSVLTLPLPTSKVNTNQPLLNCVRFLDNTYMWGSVVTGDLYMSGEKAANLPLHMVGDPNFPTVPANCSAGDVANHTVNVLGANGILGIGNRIQDCGSGCTTNSGNGYYYASTGTGPVGTVVSLAQQLQQPVSLFASNNNGVVISLPSVPDPGATTASGALIFGIGTQTNNSPGSATVLGLDSLGNFTTVFAGQTLSKGFIDSGSNGFFFGVASAPPYPKCSTSAGWYCPAATTALQATNTGTNGVASPVNFAISNAETLFGNSSFTAFSTLSGYLGAGSTTSFDWGLPFFYGRNVFTAMDGKSTSIGVGPYVAY